MLAFVWYKVYYYLITRFHALLMWLNKIHGWFCSTADQLQPMTFASVTPRAFHTWNSYYNESQIVNLILCWFKYHKQLSKEKKKYYILIRLAHHTYAIKGIARTSTFIVKIYLLKAMTYVYRKQFRATTMH